MNKIKLIIVESPTKARTISGFLGKEYKIESSFGHIRDLPKSKIGIDLEKNFEPSYIIPVKAKKVVSQLKKDAQKAEKVILATDEDREGEAIAWHLVQALGLEEKKESDSKIKRIVFHEITKTAIEEALKNPRDIYESLVDAQQARRVLDRLVGYKLSPFLWEKVAKKLSAGRVQSVALRLIVERENEIRKFTAQEYWSIETLLELERKTKKSDEKQFVAALTKINGETLDKLAIKNKDEAKIISAELEASSVSVIAVDKKEMRKNPPAPFTTSTLQQESSKRLGYSAKQTMRLAQGLYERGLITYMRTDSLNLSKESVFSAKSWIEKNLGEKYAEQAPRFFKTKSKLAQEAHEAIRPTSPSLTPDSFKGESAQEKKVYDLIWRRFVASQLPQAVFETTSVEIEAKNGNDVYSLRAGGTTMLFDGYLKIWPTKFENRFLPEIHPGESAKIIEVSPSQHFTEPPARYNEASLIKVLEENGIGRPSTYAPIISVIQDRNYVYKNEDKRFVPTEVGEVVNTILVEHFPEIVDIEFTAKMENEFDEIAEGKREWQNVIKEFYEPFSINLQKKYGEVEKTQPKEEATNEVCEKCGKPMAIKYSRFGKFLACTGFPECRNTKSINGNGENGTRKTYGKCPKCEQGEIVMRRTKKKRIFYGCSRYPDCDYASWTKPKEEKNKEEEE